MAHYIFTDYLRGLETTGEPEPQAFREVWGALRHALRRELRRRGLTDSPPGYLGIFAGAVWENPAVANRDSNASLVEPADALDELTADAYVYIFVRRLRGLRAQLKVKPNIDGLVYRNLKNFLHDRQRRHDPLGYRLYALLQRALTRTLEDGHLHLVEGGPKILNDTILAAEPDTPPELAAQLEASSELDAFARRLGDDFLPGLITARGDEETELVEGLAGRLGGLPTEGVEAFRFKDLIDPLKIDIRARWSSLWQVGEGETALEDVDDEGFAEIVRLIEPDTRFEDRERFNALADCVESGLEGFDGRKKTRDYLERLWRFLRTFALAAQERHTGPAGEATLPSHRELGKLLDTPRERLPGLLETLRPHVETCLESTQAPPSDELPPSASEEPRSEALEVELLRRTTEAWRGDAASEPLAEAEDRTPPRPEPAADDSNVLIFERHEEEPAKERTAYRAWGLALAATLLLALGTVLLVASWREQARYENQWVTAEAKLEELRKARGNPSLTFLSPVSTERGDGDEVNVPSHSRTAILVLPLPPDAGVDTQETTYRAIFRDIATGARIATFDELRDIGIGELAIEFPRGSIPAGDYEIDVTEEGSPEVMETYELRLAWE